MRSKSGVVSAADGVAPATHQRTPRSMRTTRPRPQLRAMSVALLDQGEMVPGRGTVSARGTPASAKGVAAPDRSRVSRSPRSRGSGSRTSWQKWT